MGQQAGPVDISQEVFYKSKEVSPTAKLAIQIGRTKAEKLSRINRYLVSLTIPKNASWAGIGMVKLMSTETACMVRDHPVFSNVLKTVNDGYCIQYGEKLLEGKTASDALIGAASDIATVENDEYGLTHIKRKKELGLDGLSGVDLMKKQLALSAEDYQLVSKKRRGKKKDDEDEDLDDEIVEGDWDGHNTFPPLK